MAELRQIAALFVATGGSYFGLPGVDPWAVERDARKYAGPHPVVAQCPVVLLQAWLTSLKDDAYITSGPIFRRVDIHGCVGARRLTPKSVALIVKGVVEKAGYDPESYSALSPRRLRHERGSGGQEHPQRNAAKGLSTAELDDEEGDVDVGPGT